MGLFSAMTSSNVIDIRKYIIKDGKQHIIQFELKDRGKADSKVTSNLDLFATEELNKLFEKIQGEGVEILDMQVVSIGESIKYIIRYK